MKRKVTKIRPSPNEEARMLKEESDRRRKLRIQQVREQQRYISVQIRQAVEQKRQRELDHLAEQLRQNWEQQQRQKLETLQRLYQDSLQLIGQGHRSAKDNQPDPEAVAQREEENHVKAEERYREALKELKSQKLRDEERRSRSINARKRALQTEKDRAAKVAGLPPPPPNPIQNIDSKKPHVVKKSDVSAFATTHYHMSDSAVDRELDAQQLNAREEAEQEARRRQEVETVEKRRRQEQLEKARLRGREALRREQLLQDRDRLLVELQHMQQRDLLRRRQQVCQMPPQIFQPLYKRQEMSEDVQREMEFAFEDMYTGERRVKGDLVVQLLPEPLPAASTSSQDQELDRDQELDVTVDETENTNVRQEAADTEQETSAEVGPRRPAPRRALRKLLDRIRNQRSQWVDRSRDSPTENDQIPERDTTTSIETGSMSCDDKLTGAVESQPVETTEITHPDVDTIQEFEEERRKRDEDLERQKQQELSLLQELEQQRVQLEQMLMEAQQERERLKAAVTQEVTVTQSDVSAQDQEVTSAPSEPEAEDDHSRRIREYQQRLLQQNRVHQRSVEVARQRLEQYQRALRLRYNMSCSSPPPDVVPPLQLHPAAAQTHTHCNTHSSLPPDVSRRPLQLHTTHYSTRSSVEVPTRDSDVLTPPHLPPLPPHSLTLSEVRSGSHSLRKQRQDVTSWLTDNITDRVTEHLCPPTSRPRPTSVQLQTTSDPVQTRDDEPLMSQRDEDEDRWRRVGEQAEALMLQMRRRQEEVEQMRRRQEEVEQVRRRQEEVEQMRRRQEEVEQVRRRQEEVEQTNPEASTDVLDSNNLSQTRLKLLTSLLRVMEESDGGRLSRLEETEDERCYSQQQQPSSSSSDRAQSSDPVEPGASVLPPPLHPLPPRAAKPPVTRVRLGLMEMMSQHELSVIQEVETPVDSSQVTGLEDSVNWTLSSFHSPAVNWDMKDESEASEMSLSSDRTSPDRTSPDRTSPDRTSSDSERRTGSLRFSPGDVWTRRLLTETQPSAASPDCESVHRIVSALSSDSGRGDDVSGPVMTSCRSTQSPDRRPDSSSISSGSYVTTDPELNVDADKRGRAADSLHISEDVSDDRDVGDRDVSGDRDVGDRDVGDRDVSGDRDVGDRDVGDRDVSGDRDVGDRDVGDRDVGDRDVGDRDVGDRDVGDRDVSLSAVHSVFNSSSIQRIIDKYTRELNLSLSSGRTMATENEHESTSSPQTRRDDDEEDEEETGRRRPSETRTSVVTSDVDRLLFEDDDSFRPLIGQLADQSSCLAADHRDLMERLVGRPAAHSSVIGQLTEPSCDGGRWDRTLSRMMGGLSHQSGSQWLSEGHDFYAGHMTGHMVSDSTPWLEGEEEESVMRPLVGELDQISRVSGDSFLVDLGSSSLPPEASSHSRRPEPEEQNRPSPMNLEATGGSDSFHQLSAELTNNETADVSVTFDLLQHDDQLISEPSSPPEPELLRSETSSSHRSSPSVVSVLELDESAKTEVELSLSTLTLGPGPEQTQGPGLIRELESELKNQTASESEEKGIMEQSEITLVSLTETTVAEDDDQETVVAVDNDRTETTVTEDDQRETSVAVDDDQRETRHKDTDTKEPEDEDSKSRSVTFLEVSSGVADVNRQKHRDLILRSQRRVQNIKNKSTVTETRRDETTETKVKTDDQTENKLKQKPGVKQRKPHVAAAANVRMKIYTTEQRKLDVCEMHQRTQRLYKQLEEVKHQTMIRNRQETYAKNRLKAKEFHQKTLQKLRSKQTQPN